MVSAPLRAAPMGPLVLTGTCAHGPRAEASTPQPVLERIRDLAQRHSDDAVAAILNA